jgi:hypothetical protein
MMSGTTFPMNRSTVNHLPKYLMLASPLAGGRLSLSAGQMLDQVHDRPSVPMTVRHRPPRSLDPMGRKDDLAHAHGSDAERRY